jgi:PPP family 3-phenylpropionic acid transporter
MAPNRLDSVRANQVAVLRALQFSIYGMPALLVTYIPLYFADLGFSKLQIGTIYALGPVMGIVSNLLLGTIADKARNLRLMLALLFAAQIAIFLALAPQRQYAAVAALMAAFYFFQTPVVPMTDAVTMLAAERLRRSFPSMRVFGSIGFAVSAVLFGFVIGEAGTSWVIVAGCLVAGAALLIVPLLADFQAELRTFDFGELWSLLRRGNTLLFFGLIGLVSVAHRMNEGFLSVRMREIAGGSDLVGVLWVASSLSEIPTLFLLVRYGNRLKELPLLAAASFFYLVRMLLLTAADSPWAFIAIQTMHSVTFGIFYVTALRHLSHLLPDQYRATGQALFTVVWMGLSGVTAGTLGGWMYDAYGPDAPFFAGAAFAGTALIGFLYAHLRSHSG